MAYNSSKIGRVYARPQADYETPHASSDVIADQYAMEVEMVVPPTTREIFERAAVRGGFYEIAPVSGSQHGAEFTVSKPLHGLSSSALTSDPTPHGDAYLLQALLGSILTDNYSAAAVSGTGSTTTSIDIDSAKIGDFSNGGAFMVGGAGGFLETVDAVGNTIQPILELSAAPTAGGETVYGSTTQYLSTAGTLSFTIVWRAKEDETQLVLQSCVPTSATITLGPKDNYPRLEVTFSCNGIVSETASQAITDYDYNLPVLPVPTSDASARLVFASTSGGTGTTELDIEGLQIAITQELVPQLSHNSSGGVADMLVTNRSVEVSFKGVLGAANPFDSTGKVLTDIANSAPKAVQFQLGSVSGQMFMMLLPSPIQTEVPAVEDMGGVWGLSFMLKPGNYGGSGTGVEDSDFRVAFL
jgi:hypothetical protein